MPMQHKVIKYTSSAGKSLHPNLLKILHCIMIHVLYTQSSLHTLHLVYGEECVVNDVCLQLALVHTAHKDFGHFYGSSYVAAPNGSRTPVSPDANQFIRTVVTP